MSVIFVYDDVMTAPIITWLTLYKVSRECVCWVLLPYCVTKGSILLRAIWSLWLLVGSLALASQSPAFVIGCASK